MTYHKDWEPTPAAADRFQADLEALVARGISVARRAETRRLREQAEAATAAWARTRDHYRSAPLAIIDDYQRHQRRQRRLGLVAS